MKQRSLVSLANRHISFPRAAALVGVGYGAIRDRGDKVFCPFGMNHADGGRSAALRVYPDHGWCFAELRYFSPVGLVAAVRETDYEDAARWMLEQVDYVPATYAHLWENAQRTKDLGKDELATALTTWCSAQCPDWSRRQYDKDVAGLLAKCLGLLEVVQAPEDCVKWLDGCKRAMSQVLGC